MLTLLRATSAAATMFCVSALGQATSSQQYATKPSQAVVKPLEDGLAKLFRSVRVSKNLPPLRRIKRTELLQQTCTVALEDKVSGPHYGSLPLGLAVFYKTDRPLELTSELSKIASTAKGSPSNKRFSVVVWPALSSDSGHQEYWVGVGVYASAGIELFDNWLTDDMRYRGEWKKSISPKCRTVH